MPVKASVNPPRPLARTRRGSPEPPGRVAGGRTLSRARKPLPRTRNGLLPDGRRRARRAAVWLAAGDGSSPGPASAIPTPRATRTAVTARAPASGMALMVARSARTRYQRVQCPVHDAHDDRAEDPRAEGLDLEVRDEPVGDVEHQDVHHEEEQPERQDDQRQRQDPHDRPQPHVHDREDGGGDDDRPAAVAIGDPVDQLHGDVDGDRVGRPAYEEPDQHQRAASSAAVTCSVVALPPRSGVWFARSSSTCSMARCRSVAASAWPRCSSISAPVHTWPTGLAIPCPAMSGAEPCTGSNIDGWSRSGLRFAAGAIPMLPATAAVRSLRMSPNRFEPTTTSSDSGARTTRAQRASIRTRSTSTPGWSAATASTTSSQNGIVWMIPLDFVAETTRPLRSFARSKA